MCGIAGIINFNKLQEEDRHSLRRMSNAIKYRGPDDESFFMDSNVALAFRRSSIVDLEEGRQPFYNEDKSICIIVNGEIYNHLELKKRLKNRHSFRSKSDCEVVVHLYEELGVDFLNHLNGMYSIAIYDKRKNIVILAKDRFGIKPLFYHVNKQCFIFASEIKAVLSHHSCPREFDFKNALQDPWIIGSTSTNHNQPSSFFKGIENLAAGSYLRVDLNTYKYKVEKYWDIRSIPIHNLNSNTIIDEYMYLLEDSVKKCLMSDVDVGVFLSGGIDSIIVSKFASKYKEIDSFSVLSQSTLANGDSKYAFQASKEIGISNYQVLFNEQNLDYSSEDWKNLLWLCENPMTGPEQLYKYHLHKFSKSINPNIKVMLTGQGSDEFNGGYSKLYTSTNNWKEFSDSLSDLECGRMAQNVPSSLMNWTNQFESSPFSKDFLNHIYPEAKNSNNYLNYVYSNHRNIQMYNCWHEDRTAAGNHMESRAPFLDHRIIELTLGVSPELYKELFLNKNILRAGLKKTSLSTTLINRPKVPFYYGNGVQSTHKIMMNILKRDNFRLIEEAFKSLSSLFSVDTIISNAKKINSDIEYENIEFLTRLINMGLLENMAKSLDYEVKNPKEINTLSFIKVKNWEQEENNIESLFLKEKAIDLDSIPKLSNNVEILKNISEQSSVVYILVDGELKYVMDKEDDLDWFKFLTSVDDVSTLKELIKRLKIEFKNIETILEDALRANILSLTKQTSSNIILI